MGRGITNHSANAPSGRAPVHPAHDDIVRQVDRWFTTSLPLIGYEVAPTWFGYVGTFDATATRVILRVDDPRLVADALTEATWARRRAVSVWVDDPERARILESALIARGCSKQAATEHLALVGDVAVTSACAGLTTVRASRQERVEWARIKLQCFADSEEPPTTQALNSELATRNAEDPIA